MSFANKQGLKFDAMHNPIGGRIKTNPEPPKKYKKLNNSTYMSEASIATCTSCVRARCNGHCDKIIAVEKQNVDPRKRAKGMNMLRPAAQLYEYKGKTYTANELSAMAGISRGAFYDRIKHGWTIEEAAEIPKGHGRPRKE